jgi:hypothetical protein
MNQARCTASVVLPTLLIIDDDRVHRVNPDETICARFIDFPFQPCRTYRHDLDETGLLFPECWFEPTPAMDQRVPDNLENPARNRLPEESGSAEPKERRRRVKTSSHHWTGDSGVDGRQPKPEEQPRPLPCWFEPTCSGACDRLRCP